MTVEAATPEEAKEQAEATLDQAWRHDPPDWQAGIDVLDDAQMEHEILCDVMPGLEEEDAKTGGFVWFYSNYGEHKGEVGLGSSSGNICAQQAKQILWLICPRAAASPDMGTPSLVCRALRVTVCQTSARTR